MIIFAENQISGLIEILENISELNYFSTMENVYQTSIGQHCRHIISFYEVFFENLKKLEIHYDKRSRNTNYSFDKESAILALQSIQNQLNTPIEDEIIQIFTKNEFGEFCMHSSVNRELLYLMEHTTHQLSFILLGLENLGINVSQFQTLGIAYSTPK